MPLSLQPSLLAHLGGSSTPYWKSVHRFQEESPPILATRSFSCLASPAQRAWLGIVLDRRRHFRGANEQRQVLLFKLNTYSASLGVVQLQCQCLPWSWSCTVPVYLWLRWLAQEAATQEEERTLRTIVGANIEDHCTLWVQTGLKVAQTRRGPVAEKTAQT